MSWDKRFMELARHVAGWSKDPSTKVGCVIVGRDRREVAIGYNGFPPGIEDTPERLADRPTKYHLIQHAERNALDNALFDTRGATLYVTLAPCSSCAKSVVSKGIARLVCPPWQTEGRWAEEMHWARLILVEAGVMVNHLNEGD